MIRLSSRLISDNATVTSTLRYRMKNILSRSNLVEIFRLNLDFRPKYREWIKTLFCYDS